MQVLLQTLPAAATTAAAAAAAAAATNAAEGDEGALAAPLATPYEHTRLQLSAAAAAAVAAAAAAALARCRARGASSICKETRKKPQNLRGRKPPACRCNDTAAFNQIPVCFEGPSIPAAASAAVASAAIAAAVGAAVSLGLVAALAPTKGEASTQEAPAVVAAARTARLEALRPRAVGSDPTHFGPHKAATPLETPAAPAAAAAAAAAGQTARRSGSDLNGSANATAGAPAATATAAAAATAGAPAATAAAATATAATAATTAGAAAATATAAATAGAPAATATAAIAATAAAKSDLWINTSESFLHFWRSQGFALQPAIHLQQPGSCRGPRCHEASVMWGAPHAQQQQQQQQKGVNESPKS
ncbi:hypothetical protein Emag_007519 [Eimeria magna]